ncbi:MAG: PAS domain-containing sensor histidine kinase, partial [Syntrophobacteraceae bacterium]|nr:PAS domain-containing sensor histidine kinase [Syntrophobacteraceae bacterium]
RERSPDGPLYEIVSNFAVGDYAASPLTVRIGFSAKSLHDLSRQLFRVLFTFALILLAVSFLITRWFTSMIILPVNQLLRMARFLATGRLEDVIKEVESQLPCCHMAGAAEGAPGEASGDFCPHCPHCPLTVTGAGIGPDRDASGRSSACEHCSVSRLSGKDELSRLLLAFHCMAAGIRSYQHKLQQRFEFEQRLLDACPDGIIANDRNGCVILYNKGAERLLGYEPEEVLHRFSVEQMYPAKEAQAIKKALLSEDHGGPGILLDYTTEVFRKGGQCIPIRLSAAILYEKSEELAVVGFFHDLTELRQHTDAIIEANKSLDGANKQLSRLNRHYMEMLSFVTHELKSPVANAFMSASALGQGIFGELTTDQRFMVDAIGRNLTQSMEMIRHYLDLSRIERDELPIQKRPTSILREVVEPVVKAMAGAVQESKTSLELNAPPDLEWNLDPELFRGVLTNLLSNALKYGEEPGRIRIEAKRTPGFLHLEVWNSGPGIRREDRERLFQRFQRLQSARQAPTRGTGLGLFITRTIVERHGGSIRSEGEEGEGVSFIIELPEDQPDGFAN